MKWLASVQYHSPHTISAQQTPDDDTNFKKLIKIVKCFWHIATEETKSNYSEPSPRLQCQHRPDSYRHTRAALQMVWEMGVENHHGGRCLCSPVFRCLRSSVTWKPQSQTARKASVWFYGNTNIERPDERVQLPGGRFKLNCECSHQPFEEHWPLFVQYVQFVHQTGEGWVIMWFHPIKVLPATQEGQSKQQSVFHGWERI